MARGGRSPVRVQCGIIREMLSRPGAIRRPDRAGRPIVGNHSGRGYRDRAPRRFRCVSPGTRGPEFVARMDPRRRESVQSGYGRRFRRGAGAGGALPVLRGPARPQVEPCAARAWLPAFSPAPPAPAPCAGSIAAHAPGPRVGLPDRATSAPGHAPGRASSGPGPATSGPRGGRTAGRDRASSGAGMVKATDRSSPRRPIARGAGPGGARFPRFSVVSAPGRASSGARRRVTMV